MRRRSGPFRLRPVHDAVHERLPLQRFRWKGGGVVPLFAPF
jgi:hypothetical protein